MSGAPTAASTVSPAATIVQVRCVLARRKFEVARGGSGGTGIDLIHVSVEDDVGHRGTGFTYAIASRGKGVAGGGSVRALIEEVIAPRAVGSALDGWPRTWQSIWGATHRLGRGVALAALSAVDIAVWDLRARSIGQPLYRYLGAYHESLPIYGSGRATNDMTLEELIAGSRSYVDQGVSAVKLRIGARPAEEEIGRLRAVRDALGEKVRLMVDCNERLDTATALWLGPRLEEIGVYWLEEPLPSDDIEGHARLAHQLRVPIAGGEHLQGRHEFAAYLRAGAVAILQPDAPLMGGVTEWSRVAVLAEASGVALSPHFLPELHVHLAAASPTATYIEHFPLIDDFLLETLPIIDGRVTPAARPGHGILWNDDALAEHQVS